MTIKHLYPVIEPSLNLDFANSKKLDPRITFNRGSIGTYVGDDGLIKTAAQHEARFDHDSDGNSLGLLVEESRVNYFEWSNSAVDGGTWNNVGVHLDLTSGQADPVGGTTAIRASDANNNTSGTLLQRTNLASLTTGATISYSIWLKPISCPNNILSLFVYANGTTDYINVGFTVSGEQITGITATTTGGTGVVIDSSVTPYPNGWYRCVLTGIPSTVTMTDVRTRVNLGSYQRVQGTARFDWYGAQLEVGSFPTSYIPTSGSTVTRAADVASISGDNFGVFRTNLLRYSEEFDQASWTKGSSVTILENESSAPDGTITADKIESVGTTISANQFVQFLNPARAVVSGDTYIFSVYLKADAPTTTKIRLANIGDGDGSLDEVSVTTEWQRFETTRTFTGSSSNIRCVINYQNDAVAVYAWGAQLEEGSTATDYIKSDVNFVSRASSATYYDANGVIQTAAVDEARTAAYLPDGNGNFVSAGPLLLEDAGTNLLTYSEEFDDASWTLTRATISANAASAPNGTTTADALITNTDNNTHQVLQTCTYAAGAHTFSVFCKPAGYSRVRLLMFDGTATSGVIYNVSNGEFISSSGTVTAHSSTALVNGWRRISVTITAAGGAGNVSIRPVNDSNADNFAGDGTSGIYIWGAQLETGSYATSYIPTTSSTATRAADVSTSATASVFESDWYRQDEGTVFAEAATQLSGTGHVLTGFSTGSFASSAYLVKNGSNLIEAAPNASPSNLGIQLQSVTNNTLFKSSLAFTASTGSASAAMNAGTVGTDASTGIPTTMSQMSIGSAPWNFSTQWNGTIRRLTYYPQRLPDATLQALTL